MDQNTELSPLTNHRARISEHSSQELGKFRELLSGCMKSNPEVIGAVIYGSHMKGMARGPEDPKGKSDIDAYVFVDGDLAKINDIGKKVGISPNDDDISWEQVNQKVGIPLRNAMKESMNFSETQMRDIRVRILSQQRIDEELNSLIGWEKAVEKRTKGLIEKSDMPPPPRVNLGLLFHLQIGRGLDSYRSYILQRLKQEGERGDKIWRESVISHTDNMESGKIPREIGIARSDNNLYPKKIDQAIKTYQLEYTPPKYPVVSIH